MTRIELVDLVLTKDVLCQLSYIGLSNSASPTQPCSVALCHRSSRSAAQDGAGDGDRTRDQQLGRL